MQLFLSPYFLSRMNAAVEVVQATDAIFPKNMDLESFPWRQTACRKLYDDHFPSLSSFVHEHQVNLRANSSNKKHSPRRCNKSSTIFPFLHKVEEVRLSKIYTWYLLNFTKQGFTNSKRRLIPFTPVLLRSLLMVELARISSQPVRPAC